MHSSVAVRRIRDGMRTSPRLLSAILAVMATSTVALAQGKESSSLGIRLHWTLNESGHTELIPPISTGPQSQNQMYHRNALYNLAGEHHPFPNPQKSDSIAFGKAIALAKQHKLVLAEIEFKKALDELTVQTTNADPMLIEFVASEYATLLRTKGDPVAAHSIETMYKVPGVMSTTKVSHQD